MVATDTEWLTIAEVAQELKVSRLTVSRWIKQERLAASRVGPRAVRIRRADLDQFATPIASTVPPRFTDTLDSPTPLAPLTDEELAYRRAWIERIKRHQAAMLARRNGIPLESSADIIREAREERSNRL